MGKLEELKFKASSRIRWRFLMVDSLNALAFSIDEKSRSPSHFKSITIFNILFDNFLYGRVINVFFNFFNV